MRHPQVLEEADAAQEYTAAVVGLFSAAIYLVSNLNPASPYDQTFLVARAFLDGQLGVNEPRYWLELVPGELLHYSVFPLGAVLTMLPAAVVAQFSALSTVPTAACSAVIGGGLGFFSYRFSAGRGIAKAQRVLLAFFLVFGTWTWANVVNGGAWQLALGFAVLGIMGAFHFILIQPRPFLAGLFFALAFGNRTELILAAPLFLFLILGETVSRSALRRTRGDLSAFVSAPILLGFATLAYNMVRFHSPADFGYEQIPYLFDDPLFADGFFSWRGIEPNFRTMLLEPWASQSTFPWFRPTSRGESILLVSPFLLLCFRFSTHARLRRGLAWFTILVLTAVLWLHGNVGGYQFSYRYGMVLLPFFFWILVESSPSRPRVFDTCLLGLSVFLNAYAVYAFYWAKIV